MFPEMKRLLERLSGRPAALQRLLERHVVPVARSRTATKHPLQSLTKKNKPVWRLPDSKRKND